MEEVTNPISPPQRNRSRLAHFDPDLYDLSPESNLSRFIQGLLGDAGVGRLVTAQVLARLQHSVGGSHFYDLDRFYGALFGAPRRQAEILPGNPTTDTFDEDEWEEIGALDDSYRSRMEQLARAINFGATPVGLQLAAEALLNAECDIYESFVTEDRAITSYADLEAVGTYASVEALGDYSDLESDGSDPIGSPARVTFTVTPKRAITAEERYDLTRVLNVLKPADSILRISPLGRPHLTEISLRDAASDSEWWRIVQRVAENGSVWNKRRPPFTSYQGEAWSHVGHISGAMAYNLADDGTTSNYGLRAIIMSNGTPWIYTADLAVINLKSVLSGRAMSDGILVRHPYADARRGPFIPVYFNESDYIRDPEIPPPPYGQIPAGIFYDGWAALDPGQHALFDGTRKTRQNFWATPERPQEDGTAEVVEVRLRTEQLVNYISLDVARFPHTAEVQAFDPSLGQWVSLRTWTVAQSYPQRFPRTPPRGDIHPQHYLEGHWQRCSDTVQAIRTSRLRVILRRINRGIAPRTSSGAFSPYSLAVKNWDIGYRLRGREDIPAPDEDLGNGFATTVDAFGSTVVLDVSQRRARNLLDQSSATWKCEPMPTNRAVVNLYLDLRTPDGQPQVVDTLYLDPARSGSHMNIYWSNDDKYGPFVASEDPLDYATSGVVYRTSSGIKFSDSGASWVRFDNGDLQFDPNADDWWMGFRYTSTTPTVASGDLKILASSLTGFSVVVGFDPSDSRAKAFAVAADSEGNIISIASAPLDAGVGGSRYINAWYDKATNRLHIATLTDGVVTTGDDLVRGEFASHDNLYLGGLPNFPGSDITLTGAFLKVGWSADPIDVTAENFDSYVLASRPGSGIPDYTTSSVLRYHPSFSGLDEFGFRGGAPSQWETVNWHPVERDYRVTKGFVKMPPQRVKYLNLEFTNLTPEPMESFLPVRRHVKIFPPDISGLNTSRPTKPAQSQWGGLRHGMFLGASSQFFDTPFWGGRSVPATPPTAAQIVRDVRHSSKMRETSWLFGMQPWQAGHSAPRFRDIGQHVYDEFDVVDESKVGYFVALKQIQVYRTDWESDDDTQVYMERFHDDDSLVDGYTWNIDPGRMFNGNGVSTATSKVFSSTHPVRAIQFAAHQTNAQQIIPDDSFQDERLSMNVWDDETRWHAYGDAQLGYEPTEYAVTISRNVESAASPPSSGGGTGIGSSIMRPLPTPVFSYRDGSEPTLTAQNSGGIESPQAATSPEGQIHAAARVTAVTDMSGPLVLQIIGTDGEVLAEKERYVKKGETAEWYISYQLGQFDRGGYQLWKRQSLMDNGAPTGMQFGPMGPVFRHTPGTPTGEVEANAPDEMVRVRLIQGGASTDTWKVDRLSIFDDSILWEFSNDGGSTWIKGLGIRSNPDGVLVFPKESNALCWRVTGYRPNRSITSLQIRPWYSRQMGVVMGVPHRGPNLSAYDETPPIHEDPEFKVWSRPVPKWWWLEGRRYPALPVDGQPLTNPESSFYARTASDTVSGPAIEVSSVMSAERVISEALPDPVDDPTFDSGTFTRSASDGSPVDGDQAIGRRVFNDGVMRPPDSPPAISGD